MSQFKDHDNDPVGFESKWKETRSFETCDTQTNPIKTKDEGTQPLVTSSKEVQTSQEPVLQPVSLSQDEEQSLASFLSNISNNVMKELDKNDASNAMARLMLLDFEDVENVQSEKVTSFEVPKLDCEKIKVSCVSWNCAGSLLGVGFCSQEHDTWCSHSGLINFYNTDKSIPSRSIKTKSCVTCLSMHPYEVSLVAAGMYSGEVCTYNLHKEGVDCELRSSSSRSSPVTQISWEYTEATSNRPHLVVSSLDGILTEYNVTVQTNTMTVVKKYVMSDPSLSVRPGILAFSFSPLLPSTFISSVEGGHLYSCSTLVTSVPHDTDELRDTDPPSKLPYDTDVLLNPIVDSFENASSNVMAISFSRHSNAKESLFVAASLEEIRIYMLGSKSPIHTIFVSACLGLTWSITQPQVLFYWGAGEHVIVYNVLRREQIASFEMNKADQMITVLGVNAKIPNLVATGYNVGETHVWQIPKYFKL